MQALILFVAVAPIAIWVAWSDLKFMTVPNRAVVALVAIFAVTGLIFLPFETTLWRFAQGAIVLGFGFIFNVLRIMGAGDAKFAGAMALFVASPDISAFLLLLAVCMLAAFVTHRIARRLPFVRRAAPDWQSWVDRDFPMGFALAGCLMIYLAVRVAMAFTA